VRLCLQLTGSVEWAEDLAQETLYEAWRNVRQLRDPTRRAQWLSGIARNVCRQWRRRHCRDTAHGLPLRTGRAADASDSAPGWSEDVLADEFDVEAEVERAELIRLLDRAMGLLTPVARRVLYERYVAEVPQAETARRLGLSEGAVAMKLQRSKLALRRILSRELRAAASAYGLALLGDDGWKETSLWCLQCGQRRMLGRWTRAQMHLSLRCPTCCEDPHDPATYATHCGVPTASPRATGARSIKPAVEKLHDWNASYWCRIVNGTMPCTGCGRMTRIMTTLPDDAPAGLHGAFTPLYRRCSRCGSTAHSNLPGRVLELPEGRWFMREHPRIRVLPERHVDVAGRPAIVTAFESVAGSGRLEVVTDQMTLRTLTVGGAPAAVVSSPGRSSHTVAPR
jgi:RNA polymerase sigma-70 factor (ECF subfamily)